MGKGKGFYGIFHSLSNTLRKLRESLQTFSVRVSSFSVIPTSRSVNENIASNSVYNLCRSRSKKQCVMSYALPSCLLNA